VNSNQDSGRGYKGKSSAQSQEYSRYAGKENDNQGTKISETVFAISKMIWEFLSRTLRVFIQLVAGHYFLSILFLIFP
jgi:hypothetical protein